MKDFWRIASKMLSRNRKMTWLIRTQFLVMFFLVFILVAFLFKNQDQINVLREQIGKDVWVITPTITHTVHSNSSFDLDWTEEQLDWLESKFAGKVGIISLSPNQDGDLQKIYVNDVIEKLVFDDDPKREKELLQYLLIYDSINPNTQILPIGEKLQKDLLVYVIGVGDDEMQINTLDAELSQLNPNFNYEVRQVIQSKEQKAEINLIYVKSLLFFITISFMLIMTCIISFVLLQNQYQTAKLQLFRLFGATRKDLATIFVFTNLLLMGPSYITALVLFVLVGLFWLTFTTWMLTFLISFCLVVALLVLMTIPSISLGR
ncbi:hypothetical protein [Lysinibacillus capsici]|uniref:hypothetical protein n=1 Tax=Lysinibacillus capsici TaxID=2115968 RepID=UPI0030817270|nr:hypothetical protein ICJ70_07635 [Lysinibacillus capsici]